MESNYQRLIDDSKEYARMQLDLLRLELLEKLSRILTLIAVGAIALAMILAAFMYLSLALAEWLAPIFGGRGIPLVIIGGLFLLIMAAVILFRRKLFLEPLLRSLSAILFEKKETPAGQTDDHSSTHS